MKKFLLDESGATAIEYGLIVALIVIGIVAVVTQIGTKMGESYNKTANAFPT